MISRKVLEISGLGNVAWYHESFDGNFFIINRAKNQVSWYGKCRESMARRFCGEDDYGNHTARGLGFCVYRNNKINPKAIDKFIGDIEKSCGIKGKTVIYHTDRQEAVFIKPSPYWTRSEFGRQLISLFVRCSVYYNVGDIKKSIKLYTLAFRIKKYLHRFLRGYTKTTITTRQIRRYNGLVEYLLNVKPATKDCLFKP